MAIQDALATYQAFFTAFNARDAAAWAATLAYPHLRADPAGNHVWADAAAHAADSSWDALTASGWARTQPLDPVVLKATDQVVHLAGGWQRVDAAEDVLQTNRVAYVLALVDDAWRIRARLAADPGDAPADPEGPRACVTRCLAALRLGDAADAASTAQLPFIDISAAGLQVFDDADSLAGLLQSEDGNDISGSQVDVVHAGDRAATLELELDHNDGRVLEHTLLHLRLVDGRWGIQARSRVLTGETR